MLPPITSLERYAALISVDTI